MKVVGGSQVQSAKRYVLCVSLIATRLVQCWQTFQVKEPVAEVEKEQDTSMLAGGVRE